MRSALILLFLLPAVASLLLPAVASAQDLVPAPGEAGAMSVGCPSDWEHRDAGVASFSCRDTDTGAYCGMRPRTADDPFAATRSLDEAVLIARPWFGPSTTVISEHREGRVHAFVIERGGQRSVVVIVPDRMGYARVTCGAGSAQVDALLPTFVAVASSARRR